MLRKVVGSDLAAVCTLRDESRCQTELNSGHLGHYWCNASGSISFGSGKTILLITFVPPFCGSFRSLT